MAETTLTSVFGLVVEDTVLEETRPKKSHHVDMDSIKMPFGSLCKAIPKVRKYDMPTNSNPRKLCG